MMGDPTRKWTERNRCGGCGAFDAYCSCQSTERRIESVPTEQTLAGVGQAGGGEGGAKANPLAHAVGTDDAVDLFCRPENTNVHREAATAPGVALCLDPGHEALIVGARRYSVDQLRLQGDISLGDALLLDSIAKYLRKVARGLV